MLALLVIMGILLVITLQWLVSSIQWKQPPVEKSESPYEKKEYTLLDPPPDQECSFREELQFI
jgi:hypothetical protein